MFCTWSQCAWLNTTWFTSSGRTPSRCSAACSTSRRPTWPVSNRMVLPPARTRKTLQKPITPWSLPSPNPSSSVINSAIAVHPPVAVCRSDTVPPHEASSRMRLAVRPQPPEADGGGFPLQRPHEQAPLKALEAVERRVDAQRRGEAGAGKQIMPALWHLGEHRVQIVHVVQHLAAHDQVVRLRLRRQLLDAQTMVRRPGSALPRPCHGERREVDRRHLGAQAKQQAREVPLGAAYFEDAPVWHAANQREHGGVALALVARGGEVPGVVAGCELPLQAGRRQVPGQAAVVIAPCSQRQRAFQAVEGTRRRGCQGGALLRLLLRDERGAHTELPQSEPLYARALAGAVSRRTRALPAQP